MRGALLVAAVAGTLAPAPPAPPAPPVAPAAPAALVASAAPAALAAAPRPPAAAPNCRAPAPTRPADPAAVPWPQTRHAPERLAGLADGRGVVVAVLDSGVDGRHPQLAAAVRPGADALDGGDGTVDCVGHGTAVASLVAAAPRGGTGLRGLAPGATIMPVRVSERGADGTGTGRAVDPAGLAAAIRLAVDRGAHVLTMSFVLHRDEPAVADAVRYARERGAVLVAAVGNGHERGDPTPYPAAYPGVIGVGAVGADGRRLPASQVGPYVDLVAPGEAVTGAAPGGGYATWSGTSFAAPFVAATAALVRQYRPESSGDQVAARLLATADPAPGAAAEYGRGAVNPYRAVTAVLPTDPPGPRPPGTDRPGTGPATGSGDARPGCDRPGSDRPRANGGGDPARDPDGPPARRTALLAAGTGLAAATVLGVGAAVVPAGRRRRWRPGR